MVLVSGVSENNERDASEMHKIRREMYT